MHLFRFGGGRIGITVDGASYDITEAVGVDPSDWPPVQMVALIADFERRMRGVTRHPGARPIDLAGVRLDVPIEWPNKLIAFPVN